jgi:hypothetical protein
LRRDEQQAELDDRRVDAPDDRNEQERQFGDQTPPPVVGGVQLRERCDESGRGLSRIKIGVIDFRRRLAATDLAQPTFTRCERSGMTAAPALGPLFRVFLEALIIGP